MGAKRGPYGYIDDGYKRFEYTAPAGKCLSEFKGLVGADHLYSNGVIMDTIIPSRPHPVGLSEPPPVTPPQSPPRRRQYRELKYIYIYANKALSHSMPEFVPAEMAPEIMAAEAKAKGNVAFTAGNFVDAIRHNAMSVSAEFFQPPLTSPVPLFAASPQPLRLPRLQGCPSRKLRRVPRHRRERFGLRRKTLRVHECTECAACVGGNCGDLCHLRLHFRPQCHLPCRCHPIAEQRKIVRNMTSSFLKNKYWVLRHGKSIPNEKGIIVSSVENGTLDEYKLASER